MLNFTKHRGIQIMTTFIYHMITLDEDNGIYVSCKKYCSLQLPHAA